MTIRIAHGSMYGVKQAGLLFLTFGILFIDLFTGPFFLGGFNYTGGLLVSVFFLTIAFVINGIPSLFWNPSTRFSFISSERLDKAVYTALIWLMIVDTAFDVGFVSQQMTPGLHDRAFLPPAEQRDQAFYFVTSVVIVISMIPELVMLRLYQRTFKDPGYHSNLNNRPYDGGNDFFEEPDRTTSSGGVAGEPFFGGN